MSYLSRKTYKKWAETLRLKERPQRNPLIRTIKVDLSQLPKRAEVKPKQQQDFINEHFHKPAL